MSTAWRRQFWCVFWASALVCAVVPQRVSAQDMNISLARLTTDGVSGVEVDYADFQRVMWQFAGSLTPPLLTPAGTRGVRGIYIGFESSLTGIDHAQEYWHRAVEGDAAGSGRSRFVNQVLPWGRFHVRKGLPFGVELGASLGYLPDTSYWNLGLDVRVALFEGYREDIGWIPDVAIRGAVQTLVGDSEFNMTIPSVELILSEPVVIAGTVEITPYLAGQWSFLFADSELVDLTPMTTAYDDPASSGDNQVFLPAMRNSRWRFMAGAQLRYAWFVLTSAVSFDLLTAFESDSSLPADLPRQWQWNAAVGFSL